MLYVEKKLSLNNDNNKDKTIVYSRDESVKPILIKLLLELCIQGNKNYF